MATKGKILALVLFLALTIPFSLFGSFDPAGKNSRQGFEAKSAKPVPRDWLSSQFPATGFSLAGEKISPESIFARWYDPTIRRFISEDPVWSTNLYSFVGNNPVNYVDPMGLKLLRFATGEEQEKSDTQFALGRRPHFVDEPIKPMWQVEFGVGLALAKAAQGLFYAGKSTLFGDSGGGNSSSGSSTPDGATPITIEHGTNTTAAEKIRNEGVRPGDMGKHWTITDQPTPENVTSKDYAERAAERFGGDPTVMKYHVGSDWVTSKGIDPQRLTRDEGYGWDPNVFNEGLKNGFIKEISP